MNQHFRVYIDRGARYVALLASSEADARRTVRAMLRQHGGYLYRSHGQRAIVKVQGESK